MEEQDKYIQVRILRDIHMAARVAAVRDHKDLWEWVTEAIQEKLKRDAAKSASHE